MDFDSTLVTFIGTLVTGSIGGALFTAIATDRRGARDFALKLLEKYVDKFDEIADMEQRLGDPSFLSTIAGRDDVAKTVNWLEFVSVCYMHGMADSQTLRTVDFPLIIRNLHPRLIQAKQATGELAFPDADESWPHIKRIANAEIPG